MPEEAHYIAVEGVIGVGKTSLVRLLAERLEAGMILEEATSNPFLADFYRDRIRYAFPAQMFFLLSRYRQQQRLLERDLFMRRVITDYMFAKDALFASVTLSEREFRLYQKMADLLKHDIVAPDLVIYLQASTPVIMNRIRKRGRLAEKTIDEDYIDQLNEVYNSYFFHYDESPLMVIKTDYVNFEENPEHLDNLVGQIGKPRARTTYYAPAESSDAQIR